MRSSGGGPLGSLMMLAPLIAVPVLAIVGIPQFAPIAAMNPQTDSGGTTPRRSRTALDDDREFSLPGEGYEAAEDLLDGPRSRASSRDLAGVADIRRPRRGAAPRASTGAREASSFERSGVSSAAARSLSGRTADARASRTTQPAGFDDGWDDGPLDNAEARTDDLRPSGGRRGESLDEFDSAPEFGARSADDGAEESGLIRADVPDEASARTASATEAREGSGTARAPRISEYTWRQVRDELRNHAVVDHHFVLLEDENLFGASCTVETAAGEREFYAEAEEPLLAIRAVLQKIDEDARRRAAAARAARRSPAGRPRAGSTSDLE